MNVAGDVRLVRVFVSSPNDVAPERGRVQAVAAKLNRELEGFVRFETVLWEEHFYKADSTFQAQIAQSAACDIVVSIFWTRIGTELPADFQRMADGKPYPSGTAYELLTALEASKHKGLPDVYVFRKTADAALPTADRLRRRQAQIQLDALEAFWGEWFRSDEGQFKAAFHNFAGTDAFEAALEELLRQWLDTHKLLDRRLAWPPEKGSPFRGLAPFEAEHAAVFFGRDRLIDEARRRLVGAAERGTPFLLIVGASGAGKSSLARAGLIPRLTTPGVVATTDVWRVARMKPSEGQAGPVSALAAALFAADALPELEQSDYATADALADNLRRGGEAATKPLLRALERTAEHARQEHHNERPLHPVLLLLVDQMEELFAQAVSDAERAAFTDCLARLVATGQVWCVATLRADLYEQLLRQPGLKALKEAGASFDLGPPGPAELAEIVRVPAAAAGLVFERDGEQGALDERLLADAKTADSLPLLQFTLQQLFEHRIDADGEVRLTHAAYQALGGLQGAIAQEAERAVAGLAPDALATLPRLLRRLAEPAHEGATLTLRDVLQADTTADPAENALVQALLGARILIARTDAAGNPTLRLAHDAVFASWPRAGAAAQASRDFYRVRAEVEDAHRRWREHGQSRERLIPSGVPLAEAERLVADFGPELPPAMIAYVASSRHRARARQRLVAAAAIFFFALAITATGAGVFAYQAKREAVSSKEQALVERDKATRNFKLARQTGESLVFDIANRLRTAQGMRVETVRKILETAAGTFDALAAAARDDRDLQLGRGAMFAEFGQTYVALGDLTQALKAYRESLALAERLVKANPGDATNQYNLSVSYKNVGDVLKAQGNLAEALKSYRAALAVMERLAEAEPNSARWQHGLSVLHVILGDALFPQGNFQEALQAYGDSLAIIERLAKTDPSNTEWQRELSLSYERIGDILFAQDNVAEALKSFRDGLAIAEHLAQTDPGNMQWQGDLATFYNNVGDVLVAQGNHAQALRFFRDGLAIMGMRVKYDPGNMAWQQNLSTSHLKVGNVLMAQGHLSEALQACYDGLAIREHLAKTDPGNRQWQHDLSLAYSTVGDVLMAQRNLPEALQSYHDALAIRERLAKADPGNTEWRRDLSLAYNTVGDVLMAQRNLPEALQSYHDALAIREALAQADPGNTQWQRDLSVSDSKVGAVLAAQGRLAQALQSYRDGLAIRERVARTDPNNTQWQGDLAWSDAKVGGLLVAQGNLAEALQAYRDALAVRERLAKADPGNTQWQSDLAWSYGSVGDVLVAQKTLPEALESYRDGLAINQQLAKVDAGKTRWQIDVAAFDDKVGGVLLKQGDHAEALQAYREGLVVRERLANTDPSNPERQRDLAWSYDKVAAVLFAQGKLAEVLKAYRAGAAIRERMTKADPGSTQWQSDLAWSYGSVGDVLAAQNDLPEALKSYRDALAIRQQLAKVDSGKTRWPIAVAALDDKIGDVLASQRSPAEALQSYRDALAIRAELAKADPGDKGRQHDLLLSHDKIGHILAAQDNLEDALQSYREAVAVAERLAKTDPGNTASQRDLALSYDNVGGVSAERGNLGEALRSYRDALAIIERLAKADPGSAEWQKDRRYFIGRIGSLAYNFLLARDFPHALEAADQAVSIAPDLTWMYTNRAHALMFLGRVEEARAVYLQYRGQTVQDGKLWETVVVEDFAELRKAGLTHPLMAEIEKLFAARG